MDLDDQGILKLRRTVAFGDCDPAGIVYTPRILGYCLEAIDDFWKAMLGGTGWYELASDHDRGTPFVSVSIDFMSPITPREPIDISVSVDRVGGTSLAFKVRGQQAQRDCFRGILTCVVVVGSRMLKVQQNDWVLATIRSRLNANSRETLTIELSEDG